jgi:DNA helicase-2/ATP-dependent DNA helicase PcrA
MTFFADLHIHSKYSRATARNCDLEHLALWAQKKGIAVVATGDFTHPAWAAEIEDKLVPDERGLFALRPDIEAKVREQVPPACQGKVRFVLSVEISTIYKKGDRTRKVHHVLFAPGLEAAKRISRALAKIGNIRSDGRPILGLDSRNLLEIVLASDPAAFLIPAHIWTPWFSALGSKSGFDSIAECYGDLAEHIFAVETGLSSDPAMNWQVSSLDRYRLVSNSDAHSPQKLGREATIFDTQLDYHAIRRALAEGTGYVGTVEFFPEEGKYHADGHRKCEQRLSPLETQKRGGLCPGCGKPVTVGVLNRVQELTDRAEGAAPPPTAGRVTSLIPLAEIVSELKGRGPATKGVQSEYEALLANLGPELPLLSKIPVEEIRTKNSELLAEAIVRLREGRVIREAGYDGEFGVIRLFTKEELSGRAKLP